MSLWWLSFSKGEDFHLGIAMVKGSSLEDAVAYSHRKGFNPGGEVLGFEMKKFPTPELEKICYDNRNKVMTQAEAEAMLGIKMQRVTSIEHPSVQNEVGP